MIIAKNFIWLHIPKTGGDITRELFFEINKGKNFILKYEPSNRQEKHIYYKDLQNKFPELIKNKTIICNFRKLPNWMLSWYMEIKIWGLGLWLKDSRLNNYLKNSLDKGWIFEERNKEIEFEILNKLRFPYKSFIYFPDYFYEKYNIQNCEIIRLESLKEDFIYVTKDLLDLTVSDINKIKQYKFKIKMPHSYNHNIYNFFTEEEINLLYANNPNWTNLERKLYKAKK